jgi:cytochrome b involved in lipid metabolism
VHDGKPHKHVDETYPVPEEHKDVYASTKAEAERRVLAANGRGGLHTVSVRPRGIVGPGDVQFFPVLVENAKQGKTKYIVGDGMNLADFTFVDNVVHGHLLAAEHIEEVGGEAFFITNDEPVKFWSFAGDILNGFGYGRPWLKLPYGLMKIIATLIFTINPNSTSSFSPANVEIIGNDHYFDVSKAKRLLNYQPLFTVEEALKVSLQSFPKLYRQEALDAFGLKRPTIRLTMWEVQQHTSPSDVWMVVDGKVHDLTEFVDMHPGGEEAFMKTAGRDASQAVRLPHHPESVWDTLNAMYLGPLETEGSGEEEGKE